nr:heparan-alpha-glucosaminide N-acetyltransferase domain-containing protein [Thermobifida halotolerans]
MVGVDVARALAVFGMFTVHLGVTSIGLADGPAADAFHELTRGRSSALFAFLAGVSLALLSGRRNPLGGEPLRRATSKILVRAAVLALFGVFLDLLGTSIAVILVYYAGYFLLALPLLRLRATALAATAAAIALLGPQLSYLLRAALGNPGAPPASITGIGDFLLHGYYPAFTFMAFVVAGMAVGRLDLHAAPIRAALAGTGGALALLGYGGSWLLLYPLGGIRRIAETYIPYYYGTSTGTVSPEGWQMLRTVAEEEIASLHGTVPTDSPAWLLVASPHSGTTFEIAGAVGTALLVLAGCLVLADLLRWGVYPLAAAGSMALTCYVGHVMVIAVLGDAAHDTTPWLLETFVAGALLFATLWKLLLGRGPLERLLGWAAGLAVRPDPPRTPDGGASPHRP